MNSSYPDEYSDVAYQDGYDPQQAPVDQYGYAQPEPVDQYGYQGNPPAYIRSVAPYPPDPYLDQLPLSVALREGTLFRWLIDPYGNPYCE